MNKMPMILGSDALLVILSSFAEGLGLKPRYADVVSQVFLKTSQIPEHWHSFTVENCGNCVHSPDVCRFLNPGVRDVPPGRSAHEVRRSILFTIGLGRTIRCPFLESLENSDIRHLPASGSPAKESG